MRTVRYAVRALLAQPAITAGIILSLALAIGANTAIFGLADEILWKPLPVRAPDRLVAIHSIGTKGGNYLSTSYPDYESVREGTATVFSSMAAFVRVPVLLEGGLPQGGRPGGQMAERVPAELVSARYFETVGIEPLAGRAFEPDDETAARPVALVSERLWRQRLQADPRALGWSIVIHGYPVTIVGIVPARYRGTLLDWTDPPDIWLPASLFERVLPFGRGTNMLARRDARGFVLAGRLRDGVGPGEAQAAVATVMSRLAAAFPLTNTGISATVIPAQQANFWPGHRPTVTRSLMIFGGAVGLVLLLACTNIANLLLERAAARRKEIAIRLAIGATRVALVRQLMTESLLLACAGAVVGLAFARVLSTALASSTRPLGVRLAVQLPLDYRVLAFTAALALVTAVLFGLLPALRAAKSDLVSALKGTERTLDLGIRFFSLRHVLVVAQVAISLVLLVSGGLVARSLIATYRADPGFRSDGLIVMALDLSARDDTDGRNRTVVLRALDRIGALPGVQAVTHAGDPPFSPTRLEMNVLPDDGSADASQPIGIQYNRIGPDYFRTVGIPLLSGREIAARDIAAGARVVVINDTLARRLFGQAPAVGRSLRRLNRDGRTDRLEVIGVAGTVPYHQMWETPIPMLYQPYEGRIGGTAVLVRTTEAPATMARTLREIASTLDPLAVSTIRTADEQLTQSIQPQRVAASLLGLFSVSALVLASVGLYSVLTYAVAQRTREIGLRIALGAEPPRVLRQVVGRGLVLAGIGLVVGLGLASLVTPLLATLMPGITTSDPITVVFVSVVLLVVAAIASVRPARRASRVDPLIALRAD